MAPKWIPTKEVPLSQTEQEIMANRPVYDTAFIFFYSNYPQYVLHKYVSELTLHRRK